ncbi:hypothetical protein [Rhizobium gallicum]|nr:hypothetical protein [Rhizobium gallicum]
MNDETVIEAPGCRSRVVGQLGEMLVIDAEVFGDIPAHAADAEEFAVVLSGRFVFTIGNTVKICAPGDYLLSRQAMNIPSKSSSPAGWS